MGESKYNDFRDLEVWATNVKWNSFFPFILRYLTIQLINQSIKLSLTNDFYSNSFNIHVYHNRPDPYF
jgi:hypothetical protein